MIIDKLTFVVLQIVLPDIFLLLNLKFKVDETRAIASTSFYWPYFYSEFY
jgi:hypothetical protein